MSSPSASPPVADPGSSSAAPSSGPVTPKPRVTPTAHYLITSILMVAIFLMVNYIGSRHYLREDFSPFRSYELSDRTNRLLADFPGNVSIIGAFSNSPAQAQIEDLIKQYQAASGDKVTYTRVDLAQDQQRGDELSKTYNLGPVNNVIIITYKGRTKALKESELITFAPALPNGQQAPAQKIMEFRGEQQITAALMGLIDPKPAKVYFLVGHQERDLKNSSSPTAMGQVDKRMAQENIETETLNLADGRDVPANADAVVIMGPRYAFSEAELQSLTKYLEHRGKLIVLLDPDVSTGVEALTEKYGIRFNKDQIYYAASAALGAAVQVDNVAYTGAYMDHPVTRGFIERAIALKGVRSLTVQNDNPKVTWLIQTNKVNYAKPSGVESPTGRLFNQGVDTPGPLTIAGLYDDGVAPGSETAGAGGAGTRIVAIGTSQFVANASPDSVAMLDMFFNSLNWAVRRDYALGIRAKTPQDTPMAVSPLQSTTIVLFAYALPLAALVAGVFVWYSRRK